MPSAEQPYPDQNDITAKHFLDELAKRLASGTISRRRALRMIGGALLGGVLASVSQSYTVNVP